MSRTWSVGAVVAGVANLVIATFALSGVMAGSADTVTTGADRVAQSFIVVNDAATLLAIWGLWLLLGRAGYRGRAGLVGVVLLAVGDIASLLANLVTLATGADPLQPLHLVAFACWLPGMIAYAVVAARAGVFNRLLAVWFAATPVLLFAQAPGQYLDGLLWLVIGVLLARATNSVESPSLAASRG